MSFSAIQQSPTLDARVEQKKAEFFRKSLTADLIALVGTLVLGLFLGLETTILVYLLLCIGVVLISILLVNRGKIRAAGYLFSTLVFCLTWHSVMFRTGSINTPFVLGFIVVILFSLLFLKNVELLAVIIVAGASALVLYIFEHTGVIGHAPQSTIEDLLVFYLIGGLIGFCFWLILQLGAVANELAVEDIELQYKRLFDNIPIGLYRTTVDGKLIRSNPAMWKMEGYTSELESISHSFESINEGYVNGNRRAEFLEAIATFGRVINFESEIYHRKSGRKMWVAENAYPVFDEKGELAFFEGSVQDITERKRTEAEMVQRSAELKQLSDDYKSVTDTANDLIISADVDGIISFVNPAIEIVLGYTVQEAMGRCAEDFIKPAELEAYRQKVRQALKHQKTGENHAKVTAVRKDGTEIVVECTFSSWVNIDQEIVITAFVRDVTEREKTAEFLNHAQRLDSLGLLAGGVAHDFNNLLVAILGQTSLAMRKLPEDSSARPHLVKAKSAELQAADLCRQLLAYSGKGHFQIQPIDLNSLILENISLHQVAIPQSVKLITELDKELPAIKGDRSQVQQVIMNLLINGADAIGDDVGQIKMTTEHRTVGLKDSVVWTRFGTPLKAGDYAVIHVADSGKGMDEETLNRIFEPFFTTKSAGNGLGLSAVQGIIRGHDGSIQVKSTVGKGTIFSVFFPIQTEMNDGTASNDRLENRNA